MPTKINLANISIVLCQPHSPENIGAAARAMRNMGIDQLLVVDPLDYDLTRIRKMATHAALGVVEHMLVYDTLKQALADYNYIVGTTARLGGQRKLNTSPSKLSEKLLPLSHQNRLCHMLVNIPTAEFSSLNLAQAVMIMCYELFRYSADEPRHFTPRLANRHELDAMYEQLKDVLIRISYIQPDNPDYFMNSFRHFFTRLQLRAKEVSIIRGICRQIDWYGKKCYQDGLQKKRD
jgi:tRNA/rRNA methyltransferase